MRPEIYVFGGIALLFIAIKVITSKANDKQESGIFSKAYSGAVSFGKKCCGFFKGGGA